MSQTLTSVPADNIALPVSNSGSDHSQQALRRSTDSSWSQRSRNCSDQRPPPHQNSLRGVWRYTIGIILLLATVVLWTASNFLASVGVVEGKTVALQTDKLICRLSLLTIATPSHTSSPTSTHLSSPSCCYSLLQGGYGPGADICTVLSVNIGPPTMCLLLERMSKKPLRLTTMKLLKEQVDQRVHGY